MRQFFITQRLFKFIKIKQKSRFIIVIIVSNNIISKQIAAIIIFVVIVKNKLVK